MKILAAEIVASAAGPRDFPPPDLPEVAMLGRSNVGKSSLLNRLVGRRSLARTSGTPGKTRLIHFFRIERPGRVLRLVDFPGYGYAKVSHAERERWRLLVESYLGSRAPLRCAVLLQDMRREPGPDEIELLEWLAARDVPARVAITKIDKLKRMRRQQRLAVLAPSFGLPAASVIATSAETGEGVEALWKSIDAVVDAAPAD